ncbi:MAG: asparagine synthetase B [marine bacterium B5-7]|nr:MAG: asparagine synthetase B [marine bacterium B5-7]
MCGIAGLINFDGKPVGLDAISSMTTMLKHRGPDDQGFYVRDNVGLGHRRLTIIDPEGGAQPFVDDNGQVILVFNGEIYNYIELRNSLIQLGHRFHTRSDTEVLLHCWLEWGADCVTRLRGMFAFAVVDFASRTCFLARDYFGIKPLCYALSDNGLVFSSELFPLSSRAGYDINLKSLDRYLHLGFIPAPDTVYAGVRKLPPGHYLLLDLDGGHVRLKRYWKMEFMPEYGRRTDDWLEELEETLKESVELHLRADVPCGAFLSGGIDSTVITALMAASSAQTIPTYSIGFDVKEFDETAYATEASHALNTKHRMQCNQTNPFDVVTQQIKYFGEPFADWSSVPTEHLARLSRYDVPVALSGDGGDELFGGYSRYENWLRDPTVTWEKTMLRCMDAEYRYDLWKPEFHHLVDENESERIYNDPLSDRLSTAQARDLECYLPGSVLHKVDITSMMHGLEVRTPFLDIRVAELVSRIPSGESAYVEEDGRWVGKRLLKKFLERRSGVKLSPDFIYRKKMGFTPPVKEILRYDQDTRSRVEEALTGSESKLGGYLNREGITLLFDELNRGGGAEPIWALWVLEHWLQLASVH